MSVIPPKQTVTGTDSVRINTSSGLPPANENIPEPMPSPAQSEFSASSALVTMHNAASQSGGDAFPVLKAFQDYLEAERQRARQRTVILSGIFAVVVLVVIGGFMAIWFSTMKDMRETNARLLQAAITAKSEALQQAVSAPPVQSSAEETVKIVADVVSKVQSEQSAAYAKTLETLNASLSEVQKANAEMKAELESRKVAEKEAVEKAARLAAERSAKEESERQARAVAAKEEAEKQARAATEKAAKEEAAKVAREKAAAEAKTAKAAAQPQELVIPKFPAPPPVEGYAQSFMGIRLPKEPAPLSWRIYLPEH